MAAVTGRDAILALTADVAGLQKSSRATVEHLEELSGHFERVTANLDALTKIAKESSKQTDRMARTLAQAVDLLDDHEARIAALEARE